VPILACATTQPPKLLKPRPPLPASSVAAVLEHGGELGLSDYQAKQLRALDAHREEADRTVESELAEDLGAKANSGQSTATPLVTGPSGYRRRRMYAAPEAGTSARARPNDTDIVAAAQRRLDDDDASAWHDAKTLLDDEQLPRATAIVTAYRAEVAKQRAAHKQ